MHGYIHLKALKSLIDPEEPEENLLKAAIDDYFVDT
jgi:hypothetical protein